ncbi:amidohydrolase, partial [Mycobacterium sp. ITM-2017-0098]
MLAVVLLTVGGCGRERGSAPQPTQDPTAATQFADDLAKKVTSDAMMIHLDRLQEIADTNDGDRALGSPGYDASVDYVVNSLRDKGFDVQTPEFEVKIPWADEPSLTVAGDAVEARPMQYTVGTDGDGVSGPILVARSEDTPGCTAGDYDGLQVEGAVVLVDRGSCPFGQKQSVVAER